ncbi:hypothetical protein WJX73_002363 [Symbiochloris irregularis]|uniref:Glycine cleavage system H protein n=1 Tax=Symbiochloris irregularis TaxID=706552 RepID=A0AAW1NYD1_9CHLO
MALRKASRDLLATIGFRSSVASYQVGNALSAAQASFYATVREGLKYSKSHEWVKVDGETVTIGLSDFAQSELGDVVYVDLPEVGSQVEKEETFGVLESVKAASDLYSPVTGEVTETNQLLTDEPAQVNSSPFDDGWMMKVKLSDTSQLDDLLDQKAYEQHCEESGH